MSRNGLWGLLLMALGCLALILFAMLPYAWTQYASAESESVLEEIALIESKLARAKTGTGPKLRQGTDVAPMFVSGTTEGTILAELQKVVAKKAQESDVQLVRFQPLQTDVDGQLTTIRMEVAASGSLTQLQQYALKLETGLPILFVIEAQMTPKQQAESEFPSEAMTLTLKLEANGWREASAP